MCDFLLLTSLLESFVFLSSHSHIKNSSQNIEDCFEAGKKSARQKDLVWKKSKSESADGK
jgi:hypothetical protein